MKKNLILGLGGGKLVATFASDFSGRYGLPKTLRQYEVRKADLPRIKRYLYNFLGAGGHTPLTIENVTRTIVFFATQAERLYGEEPTEEDHKLALVVRTINYIDYTGWGLSLAEEETLQDLLGAEKS